MFQKLLFLFFSENIGQPKNEGATSNVQLKQWTVNFSGVKGKGIKETNLDILAEKM